MLRMGKISYTGVEFCSINMNTAWDSDTSTFSQELPLQLELAHEKKRIQQEVQQNIWTHKSIWYHKLIRGTSPPQLIYLTNACSHCGDVLSPRSSASPPLCISTLTRYLIPNKCRPMLQLSKILGIPPSTILIWPLYPCAHFRRGPKIFKKGNQEDLV